MIRPTLAPRAQNAAQRETMLLAIGVLSLTVGAAISVFPPRASQERDIWFSVAGAVMIGVGCFAVVLPRRQPARGQILAYLGPATVVLYSLSFGVFGLAWLQPQGGSRDVINPVQIPGAMRISMVGLIALAAGYRLGPSKALVRRATRIVGRFFPGDRAALRVPSMALLLYLAGTAGRVIRLSTGQYGYLQDASLTLSSPSPAAQALSLLETLAVLGLVAAAVDHMILRRSTRSRTVLWTLAAAEISIGLTSASKQDVLFTLVILALVKAYSASPVRWGSVLAAGVVVSLLFPFVTDYRDSIRDGSGQIAPTTALAEVPSVLASTASSASPRSLLIDGPSAVARRLRQVDNVAIVRQKTPSQIDYRPGTELVSGPLVASIPRIIWPSKPVISTGLDFSREYYESPSVVYSASAVTIPGDLYRHGGLLPLTIGMLLLGVLLRFFDRVLSPARDPRQLIIYVPVFLHLLKLESDVTVFLVGLVQLVLLLVAVSWLVFSPQTSERWSDGPLVDGRAK